LAYSEEGENKQERQEIRVVNFSDVVGVVRCHPGVAVCEAVMVGNPSQLFACISICSRAPTTACVIKRLYFFEQGKDVLL
jgi:hypothetical protein